MVVEYVNVDMCTPQEIKRATINLLVGYRDRASGLTRQQTLKLITQEQGVFSDADAGGYYPALRGQPADERVRRSQHAGGVWIYRDVAMEGHSEGRLWLSGYSVPASATP